MAGALQPRFLARERDEDHRALRCRVCDQVAGEFDHDRHTARVVVGAEVDRTVPRVRPLVRPAAAQVIVVCRHQHRLTLHRGIRARQHADDVAHVVRLAVLALVDAKHLRPRTVVAAGLQPDLGKLLGDVVRRPLETRRAEAAARHLFARQHLDVGEQAVAREHGRQFRQCAPRWRSRARDRLGARLLRSQVAPQRRIGRGPLAFQYVRRFLAGEREIRILAVVGQLGADAGERRRRTDRNPADRLGVVAGMTADDDRRMIVNADLGARDDECIRAERDVDRRIRRE